MSIAFQSSIIYMTEIELLLIALWYTIRTCHRMELYNEKLIVLTAKEMLLLHTRPTLDSPMEERSSKENARGAV